MGITTVGTQSSSEIISESEAEKGGDSRRQDQMKVHQEKKKSNHVCILMESTDEEMGEMKKRREQF